MGMGNTNVGDALMRGGVCLKKILACGFLLLLFINAACGCGRSGAAADDTPNIWELFEDIEVEYISMTNAENTIEPRELRAGDEFLGLRLEGIQARGLVGGDGVVISKIVSVHFSGELVVSGVLAVCGGDFARFVPDERYLYRIPDLAGVVFSETVFSVEFGGKDFFDVLDGDVVFKNAVLRLGDIWVSSGEGRSVHSAGVIEVAAFEANVLKKN